jgi:hypothetical protein
MSMKKGLFVIASCLIISIACTVVYAASNAKSFQHEPEKSGKFIFQNKLNKCQGFDMVSLTKNLTAVVEWIRNNDSTVNQPVGNDTIVSLSGNLCDKVPKNDDFGIQSSIYFSFHHFWIENGVSYTATGNTARGAGLLINNPTTLISSQFTETGFNTGDPSRLKQPLEEALGNLQKYYTVAPVIKEIAPGVRLYSSTGWFKGVLVIFNPERPDIWIPVTVKEIMEAKLAYYKVKQEIDTINYEKTLAEWAKMNFKPAQVMYPNQYDVLKKEFENFTSKELNLPAFSSPQSGISTINALGEGRPVVRFNPACWNRSLPTTAVQFISMEYRPAAASELEGFKQRNDGLADYVGMFYNNLPVEKMGILIQK